MEFFLEGVAGELDDFHAVTEGGGHGVDHVSGGDEEDAGEVEGDVEVMVGEAVVLLGIEDFEEGGGGVAAEVHADFVDFIEHEDGVAGGGLAEVLDDASGHGADVGAAVAADFRLVAHAAEGHADEFAAEGAGDGLAEGGFADPGGADEAEDGAFHLLFEFEDGEVFEDAFFDFLEVVMVLVEDLAGAGEVELVFGANGPGEVGEHFDVGSNDAVFGGHGGDGGEAFLFLACDGFDLLGHAGGGDALVEFVEVALLLVVFAEFLADGFELFAEEEFALIAGEGLADLVLDFDAHLEEFGFAVEDGE